MNYFSHFYVLPVYNNSYLTLGSILPDMLRNAKSELATLTKTEDSKEFQQLTNGIISHIEVDKEFHNSDFFFKHTKYMSKLIREHEEISMNKYTQFYAHILLELLIDYVLINKNESLLNDFYDLIEEVDNKVIEQYFEKNFPSQDVELFIETLDRFQKRKFLSDYTNIENVINFSLHVYEKTTKQKTTESDKNHFLLMINQFFLPKIEQEVGDLFQFLNSPA